MSKVKELRRLLGGNSAGTLNDMFAELMNVKDAKKDIILPKFVQSRNIIKRLYKLLLQLGSYKDFSGLYPTIGDDMREIMDFAIGIKETIVWETMTEETEQQYDKLTQEELNQFYKKIKSDQFVKDLIALCGRLKRYQLNFNDLKNLKDGFVGQEPGLDFKIFYFSNFDLKKIWAVTDKTSMIRKYILTTFHVMYNNLYQLYKVITSPDVDIDEFTSILTESLGQLEKRPGLNRCKRAFKRIRDSVGLLKNKFDDYYRDSVSSENPNLIVENYILDVANTCSSDAKLTREFRVIIQYMHKAGQQSGKAQDPAVKQLFKLLNKNFEVMDKKVNPNKEPEPVIPEEELEIKTDTVNYTDRDDESDELDALDMFDKIKLGEPDGQTNTCENTQPLQTSTYETTYETNPQTNYKTNTQTNTYETNTQTSQQPNTPTNNDSDGYSIEEPLYEEDLDKLILANLKG